MVVIADTTLSTAITGESGVDLKWFAEAASPVVDWFKAPVASAANFASKIVEGGKAVVESIASGTFGKIFNQWAKDDPIAAGAGTIAAGLAGGGLILLGGAAVGWVAGGVGAAVGTLGVGGTLVAGATIGALADGILNAAEQVYSFDFQVSDESLIQDIKAAVDNLYEPAGNFIGRQIATIAVGGLASPPKVQIDIEMMALVWQLKPELRQELLQNVSNFAYQGIQTGLQIAIKSAFLYGRRGIKKLWKQAPDAIKKLVPGLDKAIATWGDKGKEPWSIEDG
ncbi:hypothetical protein, partial [Dapis sp. BLCC M172]|uniref:hypothetical protein n=1 Tax=Dapis sp. BLCC M172 TaxID=2975281 RepID=UPI003CF63901